MSSRFLLLNILHRHDCHCSTEKGKQLLLGGRRDSETPDSKVYGPDSQTLGNNNCHPRFHRKKLKVVIDATSVTLDTLCRDLQ